MDKFFKNFQKQQELLNRLNCTPDHIKSLHVDKKTIEHMRELASSDVKTLNLLEKSFDELQEINTKLQNQLDNSNNQLEELKKVNLNLENQLELAKKQIKHAEQIVEEQKVRAISAEKREKIAWVLTIISFIFSALGFLFDYRVHLLSIFNFVIGNLRNKFLNSD